MNTHRSAPRFAIGLLPILLRAAFATARRRWRRGPALPSWSFALETMVDAMRAQAQRAARLSAPERRLFWERMTPPDLVLRKVRREPALAGGVPAVWFRPRAGQRPGAVLLYFHGGSYLIGSTVTHGAQIARLALASGCAALGLDYRLAPEHPFPAPLEDALAAYRWLLAQGVAPERLLLAGDSAGAGLALALLLTLRREGLPLPAGAALLCPWVDLSARGGTLASHERFDWATQEDFIAWERLYLGADGLPAARDPRASPLFGDLTGLPPLLIQVGGAEMVLDQASALAERARAAAVPTTLSVYPEMIHNWHLLAGLLPRCQVAIDEAGAWLRARAP